MKIIDLSRDITEDMQVCPCDKKPKIEQYTTVDREGVNVKIVTFGTHTGAHIDAPAHGRADGATLNELPVERFVGQGVLVDLADRGARYEITPEDLQPYASLIEPGDFVVLNTGWAKHFNTPHFFNHPYLGRAAAEYLASLKVSLVATDGSSVDAAYGFADATEGGDDKSFEEILHSISAENVKNDAHTVFFAHNMLIVEYLDHLDQVGKHKTLYSFLPLRIQDADGSPIRAVCMEGY